MLKSFNIILAGCCLATSAFAASHDTCSQLPGYWKGIYNLKNAKDCVAYRGCTHLIQADLTDLNDNNYKVKLKPVVGQGGTFNISCENGIIKSPVNPGNTIHFTCDEMNHCSLVYEDERLSAEAIKG